MKYQMREKMFAIGDDYWIETDGGQPAFKVDGKALRIRKTLILEAPEGDEVQRFLADHRDEAWPAIRGVIHAAGVATGGPLRDMTATAFAQQLRPKLQAAWILQRALAEESLDFFVLCSSAAALIPSPLVGAYAAANACLDALVERRRRAGQPGLSIAFGPWAEIGMAAEYQQQQARSSSSPSTMTPMKTADALHLIGQLWQGTCGRPAILPIDWSLWQTRYKRLLDQPLFARFAAPAAARAEGADLDPAADVASLPVAVQGEGLLAGLSRLIQQVLGHQGELDVEKSFSELGVDSLMAFEAKEKIARVWSVDLPVLELLHAANIAELAQLVERRLAGSATVDVRWPRLPTPCEFPSLDGLIIHGHLSLPTGPGPHPAIVVHTADTGGALDDQGRYVHLFEHEPLVRAGFAVLTVDQRGAPGHGDEYAGAADLGGADVEDLLAAARYLADRHDIDDARIGLVGTSRGAYAGLLALQRAPDRFRAAVLRMGFYDPLEYGRNERQLRPETAPLLKLLPSWDAWFERMGAPERNPLNRLDQVTASLFVIHGEDDRIADVEHSRRLVSAMTAAGRPTELRTLPGVGHDIEEVHPVWRQIWDEIASFLQNHLSPETEAAE